MEQNKKPISFNELKDKKGWKCGMATLPKAQFCTFAGEENKKDDKNKKE